MRLIKMVPLAAALLLAGCADLDVTNPNNPDRERVLSDPSDVESLISTSFRAYYDNAAQTNPNIPTSAMAESLTGGFFDFAVHDLTTIPRTAWDNSPLNTRGLTARGPWDRLYTVISSVNDGLLAIDGGLQIPGPAGEDNTARARAFGKFVQGISHAYIAMHADQALVVDETPTWRRWTPPRSFPTARSSTPPSGSSTRPSPSPRPIRSRFPDRRTGSTATPCRTRTSSRSSTPSRPGSSPTPREASRSATPSTGTRCSSSWTRASRKTSDPRDPGPVGEQLRPPHGAGSEHLEPR
jgi:hypothetical protein